MSAKIPTPIGCRFGSLTVVGDGGVIKTRSIYIVKCDCGTTKRVSRGNLTSGEVSSCGDSLCRGQLKHGGSNSKEYRAWIGMKTRCYNKNKDGYKYHGGRGIKMCKRWRDSFAAFLEDMGRRPSPNHSIDRKNNNGNYTPSNCRWATKIQQNRNMRTTRMIPFKGVMMAAGDVAEIVGVKVALLRERLCRGVPVERAIKP